MLKLIEEDADSFAQRAEMYYQKRPELVKLVEEFYRAYRALAERYDHLTGEIKQNVPRALQVQYGLSSCDSPQSPVVGTARYICSPLRKGQALDISPRKASQSEEQVQSEVQKDGTDDRCEHKENGLLPDEGSSSSSDSDMENSTALHKLQEEIWSLREQNSSLTDDHKKTLECNSTMQIEIGRLREDHATFQEEIVNKVNEVSRDLSILQMENNKQVHELLTDSLLAKEFKETCFSLQEKCDALDNGSPGIECCNDSNKDIDEVACHQNMLRESVVKEKFRILDEKVLKLTKDYRSLVAAVRARVEPQRTATTALRFLRAGMFGLVEKNKKLREDLSAKIEDEIHNKATKELSNKNAKRIITLEQKIEELQGQMVHVAEENRIQKLVIHDRGEEKREAIRQLCFSIDILKSQNQALELVLGRMKKRFLNFNVPVWRKILLGVWKGSKAQPYALAH